MASEARIGIRTDTTGAEQGITSVRGMFKSLAGDAKSSILTGVGLGAGVTAFSMLGNAVGAATDFLKDSVQAAIDDEASVRRLTSALHANVPGWDGNTAGIERTIAASQKLGFTDDETRASLTFLTAATHDVAKAQELHNTAMDLARFKGISLQAASEALVKVESGRYRLLASLGITLRDGATATEALAAVQAVAAGQAAAFGDTTAGAMLAAQIAIEEAGESIGRELLPVIKSLAQFLVSDVVPAVRQLVDAFKLVDWGVIAAAIGGLVNPLGNVADGMRAEAEEARAAQSKHADYIVGLKAMAIEAAAAGQAIGENFISQIRNGNAELRKAGFEAQVQLALGYLDGQNQLKVALEVLTRLQKEELTRGALQARALGVLQGSQLASGMNDSRPGVQAAARLVNAVAMQTVGSTAGFWTGGKNVSQTWVNGFLSTNVYSAASGWLNGVKQLLVGNSPPPKGPLKGIDKGGENIGKAWAQGMVKGLDNFRVPSLPQFGLEGAAAGAGGPGGTGGGVIHTHVYLDGRQIAEAVTRRQYYGATTTGAFTRG
jgi:hypothetical protein